MKNSTLMIIMGAVLIGAFTIFSGGYFKGGREVTPRTNVSVVDNIQVIEIEARGGYTPGKTIAQAGVPTVLRFKTRGTFDCSAALRIPSLNISRFLPNSGTVDIDVGTPEAGKLLGMCSMGMYRFEVDFQG